MSEAAFVCIFLAPLSLAYIVLIYLIISSKAPAPHIVYLHSRETGEGLAPVVPRTHKIGPWREVLIESEPIITADNSKSVIRRGNGYGIQVEYSTVKELRVWTNDGTGNRWRWETTLQQPTPETCFLTLLGKWESRLVEFESLALARHRGNSGETWGADLKPIIFESKDEALRVVDELKQYSFSTSKYNASQRGKQ